MAITPNNEDEVQLFNERVPIDPSKSDKPAVRALADLPGASEVEALGITEMLVELMRKVDDVGERQSEQGQHIEKLYQRAAERDAAVAAYERNQEEFLDKIKARSERYEVSPSEQARMKARAMKEAGELSNIKRVQTRLTAIAYKEQLKQEPTETIISTGIPELIGQPGGQPPKYVVRPESIRVNGIEYWLPVSKPIEVPKSIAELFRQRQRSNEENAERKKALSNWQELPNLKNTLGDIDARYADAP